MSEHEGTYRAFTGKTYSLYGINTGTNQYYKVIKKLADLFLQQCPDKKRLLFQIQKASVNRSFFKKRSGKNINHSLISFIKKTLRDSLSVYTAGVKHHLRTLPLSQRFDSTLMTKEEQYHLYMLEIELVNRIYKEPFKSSQYKFALLPHCLRDFRPDCRSVPGDVESVCKECTERCFIHLGSLLLKKYNIHPYISVTMDLEKLFKRLKAEHPSIGALGVACVPELVNGMRICINLDIPPVGVPLDANRCARWMKQACESSFNLKMLEALIK
ncbi:MAG: DUF116 domain-containing protein [Thermodesulfovibrionia bacterium]|nr:DUF116 domain-containing protein [Thermodesulfovibrionia bacterium]MCK5511247.1 DUF116 domain-containing protein [Thermodesulfovibrionia bacterium]